MVNLLLIAKCVPLIGQFDRKASVNCVWSVLFLRIIFPWSQKCVRRRTEGKMSACFAENDVGIIWFSLPQRCFILNGNVFFGSVPVSSVFVPLIILAVLSLSVRIFLRHAVKPRGPSLPLQSANLVYKSCPFFSPPPLGVAVTSGPDARVMSGGAIINISNCRETKGPKWKGLAGWGDLTMSCTSVIFLVRLELSQGFNWNPDFKATLHPSTPPSPQTNSTPALTLLAGSTHVQRPYTQSVTATISERASPCTTLPGIDSAHICSRYLGAWGDFVWAWLSIKALVRSICWANIFKA